MKMQTINTDINNNEAMKQHIERLTSEYEVPPEYLKQVFSDYNSALSNMNKILLAGIEWREAAIEFKSSLLSIYDGLLYRLLESEKKLKAEIEFMKSYE